MRSGSGPAEFVLSGIAKETAIKGGGFYKTGIPYLKRQVLRRLYRSRKEPAKQPTVCRGVERNSHFVERDGLAIFCDQRFDFAQGLPGVGRL
jgi:hypothetical protein